MGSAMTNMEIFILILIALFVGLKLSCFVAFSWWWILVCFWIPLITELLVITAAKVVRLWS